MNKYFLEIIESATIWNTGSQDGGNENNIYFYEDGDYAIYSISYEDYDPDIHHILFFTNEPCIGYHITAKEYGRFILKLEGFTTRQPVGTIFGKLMILDSVYL